MHAAQDQRNPRRALNTERLDHECPRMITTTIIVRIRSRGTRTHGGRSNVARPTRLRRCFSRRPRTRAKTTTAVASAENGSTPPTWTHCCSLRVITADGRKRLITPRSVSNAEAGSQAAAACVACDSWVASDNAPERRRPHRLHRRRTGARGRERARPTRPAASAHSAFTLYAEITPPSDSR